MDMAWEDPRLEKFPHGSRIDADKIWAPKLSLRYSKKMEVSMFDPKYVETDIRRSIKVAVHANFDAICPMDFTFFPHDEQKCLLFLDSDDLFRDKLMLRQGGHIVSTTRNEMPQHFIKQFSSKEDIYIVKEGEISTIEMELVIGRYVGYFVTQFYGPIYMAVTISWISIVAGKASWRPIFQLLCLLIVVVLSVKVSKPSKVSYNIAVDWFFIINSAFIASALIESLIILKTRNEEPNQADRNRKRFALDHAFAVIFPLLYISANIAYWIFVLI